MDKTLQILINNANNLLQDKITITKSNRGYIFFKNDLSMECYHKNQLVSDILAEVYNHGKQSKLNEFKQLLEV